ncbi:MAG: response regulator [Deltaproteobacteria bacterium]|nr:response regulator [Deltaproteobacteria bacterium]MBW1990707.1 response regulator [Deltaproteobacteria bacterium]
MAKIRVLVVDDEVEFVSALAERLNLRGFETQTATSGEEALAIVKTYPPDVVLLDVLMPGMSGMEVLKRIKTKHPQIQVILLTGRGSWDGIQGIREGAYDCLMKPIKIEELVQIMMEAVASNQQAVKGGG